MIFSQCERCGTHLLLDKRCSDIMCRCQQVLDEINSPDGRELAQVYTDSQDLFDLRQACRNLLNGVNSRHPDKDPDKWTCPDMEVIDMILKRSNS